jgi:hypothetical protein
LGWTLFVRPSIRIVPRTILLIRLFQVVQIGKTLEAVKELERRIEMKLIDSKSDAKL